MVAEGWYVGGDAFSPVAQPCQDVPRRGDGKEKRGAGEGTKLTPAAEFPCEEQVDHDRAAEEDRGDEAFGEHGAGEDGVDGVHAQSSASSVESAIQAAQEAIEANAEEQCQQHIRDEVAGEEKDAGGGEDAEGGVGGGALSPCEKRPSPGERGQQQDGERERQVGGEDVEAEELVVDSGHPIGKRWLFKVADAVDVERDPVAGERHVAGGAGMGRISVIKQAGGEEGAEIDCQEDGREQQKWHAADWRAREAGSDPFADGCGGVHVKCQG